MWLTWRWVLALSAVLIAAGCSSAADDTTPAVVDRPSTTTVASSTTSPSPDTAAPATAVPATDGLEPVDTYCRSGPFVVDEERASIVDPEGRDFLPTGINLTAGEYRDGAFWQGSSVTDLTAEHVATLQDVWRFNTVRLNVDSRQAIDDIWTSGELDRVIGLFTDAGMVVIVENHAFGTGLDPTIDQIDLTADGFGELARRWNDNSCVWFNPYNEPGGKLQESVYTVDDSDVSLDDAWREWHVPVIEAIRFSSPDAVVVLDDTHFGQGRAGNEYSPDESAILTYGPGLNEQYDNLLYSVHLYDRWGGVAADLDAFFDGARDAGLAVVVGETGGHPEQGPFFTQGYWPTSQAFFASRRPGVGVLLWHGRTGYQSGMSVSVDQGRRVAVWEVTARADTEASGRLLWDWTRDPPAAVP